MWGCERKNLEKTDGQDGCCRDHICSCETGVEVCWGLIPSVPQRLWSHHTPLLTASRCLYFQFGCSARFGGPVSLYKGEGAKNRGKRMHKNGGEKQAGENCIWTCGDQ